MYTDAWDTYPQQLGGGPTPIYIGPSTSWAFKRRRFWTDVVLCFPSNFTGYLSIAVRGCYHARIAATGPTTAWTLRRSFVDIRRFAAAAIDPGDRLWLCGGEGPTSNACDVFDVATGGGVFYTQTTNITAARTRATMVFWGDTPLLVGGIFGTTLRTSIDEYTDSVWRASKAIPPLPSGRTFPSAAVYSGCLYVAGGTNQADVEEVIVFCQTMAAWRILWTTSYPRQTVSLFVSDPGRVYEFTVSTEPVHVFNGTGYPLASRCIFAPIVRNISAPRPTDVLSFDIILIM